MSDRGAPQFAGILALLAIVFVVVYWIVPAGDPRPPIDVEPASTSTDDPPAIDESDDEPVDDPTPDPAPVETLDDEDLAALDDDAGEGDADDAPAVVAPVFREFTIRPPGMTLEEVSLEVYGTRRHWRAIARMNGHSLDPNRVRPGQVIKIPRDPENVQGVPAEGADEGDTPAPEPAYTEYIVSRDDTLWDIAKALYGSGVKWTVIRDANRELVGDDGSRLRAGMVLRIPPPQGD
jgi:nucleoid-associated protein YgaU